MAKNTVFPISIPRWLGIAIIITLVLLPAGALAVTYVNSPMVIEEPGTYVLTTDITNYDGIRWQNGTDYYVPCIVILASDVIFDGNNHMINGQFNASRTQNDQIGIYVDSGLERVTVLNTGVNGFNYGIYYYGVNSFANADAGGRIDRNTVNQNDVGIVLDTSQGVTVSGNTATNNRHNGIELYSADENHISGNIADNNIDNGIYLTARSDDNYVIDNTGNHNINSSSSENDDIAIRGNGITIDNSSGNFVRNNIVTGNFLHGIAVLPDNSDNWVDNNIASGNGHGTVGDGIYIDTGSQSTNVNGNHAFDNTASGIHLNFVDDSLLINNNTADGNGIAGIILEGSNNNSLGSNIAFNNKYGIELVNKMNSEQDMISSDNNILSNNTLYENTQSGIFLNGQDNFEPMINNKIIGNNVHDNTQWGIDIQNSNLNKFNDNYILTNGKFGVKLNSSEYNVLFNNFFNNGINVGFEQQSNNPNTWSVLQEPGPNIVNGPYKGGNYWAQPDGNGFSQIATGPNNNGFINNESYIGPSNIDYYPLWFYPVNVPVKAAFNMVPGAGGLSPLTIQFIDKSSGSPPLSYSWNFDDGSVFSTEPNPTHTFTSPVIATYNVSLTVTDIDGKQAEVHHHVTIGAPADTIVAFTAIPKSGTVPLTVSFLDQSTANPDSSLYSWDFGDGSTSTDRNPVHEYTMAGTYDVTLIVTTNGNEYSTTQTGFIFVNPPGSVVADFYAVPSNGGIEPLMVHFYDQSTGSPAPSSWYWNFGDGQISTLQSPIHNYTKAGNYTPKLTVSNTQGPNTKVYPGVIYVRHTPPVAAFNGTPLNGSAPLTVKFNDLTTGFPTQWHWDFGDGSTSINENPIHTFQTEGTFTVTLEASNDGGSDINSTLDYITVGNETSDVPVVNFTANPMSGPAPLTVQFTDHSTNNPTRWFWKFGDNTTSTLQNPTHTYTVDGIYNVTLVAANNAGSSCDCNNGTQIIVGGAPVADFTTCAPCGPRYGTFPLTVTFKDLSTGMEPRTYLWNFGDGQTSTERNPVHNYMLSNNYTVSLTITNPLGSNTTTKPDFITSSYTPPPVVDFSASPRSGTNPMAVVFTDQTTGSLPLQYVWDFGDGSVAPERFDKNPVHTYLSTGTYNVTLTATNPGGEGVKIYPHFIGVNLPPAPIAEFTAVPWSGSAPLTVSFVDQSTESPTGSSLTYFWQFGDGQTSSDKNPTHTYTIPNTYSVSLTVTGAGGSSSPRTHEVLVNTPSSLVANFNAAPVTGITPLTVQFIDTSTGTPTSWQWSFGDGSFSSLQSPSHQYTAPGKYTVSLTISNAQGSNTMMMSDLVYVRNIPPTADFSGNPLTGAAPLTVQFTDESTGNAITSWHWDFGDGTISSGANNNPIHIYQTQGLYTVILVASNDGGSSTESKPAYVNVSNFAPSADFSAVPSSGPVPLNVQFTDQSSGSGLNYLWQFGDGQTSTIQNPSHTYTTSGIFNVNLTVNNGGGSSSKIKTISTNSPDASNISLSTGWNFISVPKVLAPGFNSGAIFNNVDTGGHSIWQYDAFNQTWTRILPSSLVQPLFGYWIYSTSPNVVPLVFSTDPTQVPPTKQLATGWNSIGFTGVDPATARDTLVSVNTSWTQAMGFDAQAQSYDTQIVHGGSGQFSDSRLLFPTDGYWLYMTSPGTLSAIGG